MFYIYSYDPRILANESSIHTRQQVMILWFVQSTHTLKHIPPIRKVLQTVHNLLKVQFFVKRTSFVNFHYR